MIPKDVYLDDSSKERLKSGIKKIAGAVKSTLGPAGQTVILESEQIVGQFTVTKDGVTVAKSINLDDPIENIAVQMMKQASDKTATIAGDGTTTGMVLCEAILDASDEFMSKDVSKIEVIREINNITEQVIKNLKSRSLKVTGKRLRDVATVSANNDPFLGKLISDAYKKVKHVTVERSQNADTYSELIEGIKIDRGWSSRYLITDEAKEEAVLEKPLILISDVEITDLMQIEQILVYSNHVMRPLLLIANLTPPAMAALNLNVSKKKINACHIIPPSSGYRKTDLLKDLSTALGGAFFAEDTGDNFSAITPDSLGSAKKAIISRDKTVIVRDTNKEIDGNVKTLVSALERQHKDSTNPHDRTFTKERIANISGGVGVIYVGANSPIEQSERYDRVDDAVRAVAAAIDGGVLPGGGIALLNEAFDHIYLSPNEYVIAGKIMSKALQSPFGQILINAGKNPEEVLDLILKEPTGVGLNLKTGYYGNMVTMGVIDPTKVTITALQNAVSVATTIMSSSVTITNMRANVTA